MRIYQESSFTELVVGVDEYNYHQSREKANVLSLSVNKSEQSFDLSFLFLGFFPNLMVKH